ncbi:RNA-binding protein, putative [Hepatocystis sp. ex Piliocolobus tephrosceles]|nr:RNA-binding protein, putative [Hepatocystis sp. ex Piliocolobus tephrosceles]
MNHLDENRESNDHEHHNAGSTLYVSNLSSRITTWELQDLFEQYGTIEKCHVICNPITKESRQFGFVTFHSPDEAQNAMNKTHNMDLEGRLINVQIARRDEPYEPTPGQYKGTNSKYRRNYEMRRNYYARNNYRYYDRRRVEARRYPYYRYPIKSYGYRNNTYRNYDNNGRNTYNDNRRYERKSIDYRYHKRDDYYKKPTMSSDDEKYYSGDDSGKRRRKYDKYRRSFKTAQRFFTIKDDDLIFINTLFYTFFLSPFTI